MRLKRRRSQGWTAQTAPELTLARHVLRRHGKKATWVEENHETLRSAHIAEHAFETVDHGVNDDLI